MHGWWQTPHAAGFATETPPDYSHPYGQSGQSVTVRTRSSKARTSVMAPAGLLQSQVQSSYKPKRGFPSQFCQQLQEYPSEGVASHGRNGANWEAVCAILTVAILFAVHTLGAWTVCLPFIRCWEIRYVRGGGEGKVAHCVQVDSRQMGGQTNLTAAHRKGK